MSWTWKKVVDPIIGALLNEPMKTLENDLALAEKTFPAQARIGTTDATVTTLATQQVPINQTLLLSGYVVARRSGGSAGSVNDGAAYRVELVARNTAGVAAIIGSSVTAIGESQVGWDCTLTTSGASVLVRVTGAINNTVSWRWTRKMLSVST